MILLYFHFIIAQSIEGSGKVAIQLNSYVNQNDLDFYGSCCNGDLINLGNTNVCSKDCNTLLTLCLDSYQSTADFGVCPYGRRNLSAINDQSTIRFTTPTAGDVENPVLMAFAGNYQV